MHPDWTYALQDGSPSQSYGSKRGVPSSIHGEQREACLAGRSGREDSSRETELQGRGQPLSWTCVVWGAPGVPTSLCTMQVEVGGAAGPKSLPFLSPRSWTW